MLNKFIPFAFLFVVCLPGIAQAELNTAKVTDLLDQLRTSYGHVNTFTAEMRLQRFAPEYAEQNQQVWFKRPKYIKLKQLGPYKKGARLAIKPDGSIRGHLGGLLRFIVVSLKPDDENLFGVTQDSVFNTDYDAVIDIAYELVSRMTRYEITPSTAGDEIILDTFYNDKIDHYRLIIDAKNMMIIGMQRYARGQLLHQIDWKDLQLNPALSDSLFDL